MCISVFRMNFGIFRDLTARNSTRNGIVIQKYDGTVTIWKQWQQFLKAWHRSLTIKNNFWESYKDAARKIGHSKINSGTFTRMSLQSVVPW